MEIEFSDLTQAVDAHGSIRAAARNLGIPESTLRGKLKRGLDGIPSSSPTYEREKQTPGSIIPDGYRARGTSTLYDADGVPKLSWVKTGVDHERQAEILREMAEAFTSSIPRADAVSFADRSTPVDVDHMNLYVLSDAHIGMTAWGEETKSGNWDLKIAEETLVAWFKRAIDLAPNTDTAVFAQLGDFLHYTGMEAKTPTSGHILDADGRFQKMVRVAIRVMRRIIAMLLNKHRQVHVIPVAGNHDDAAAGIFKEAFPIFYENEPRLTFDSSPSVYHAYQFGKTGVFFTHGHKAKFGSADRVVASLFKPIFGTSDFCYLHSGHLHHRKVEEGPLMESEIHPTLAAPDAYAALNGYLSKRSSNCITYHREYGEVSRIKIPVEMLKLNHEGT